MINAIFYKEWIKTKWVAILSFLTLFGFSTFLIYNLYRMIELKGAVHIWEVMIHRDALFITMINYIPLIIGVVFAITQFVPEMQRKQLKLTLHLPYDSNKMVAVMVGYGMGMLILMFGLTLLYFTLFFSQVLVIELVKHIMLTALVWFLAGIVSSLLTAWIVLEPTWKRRIFYLVISILLLRIFFMSGDGQAYNSFIGWIFLFIVLFVSFAFMSVIRFKEGRQD